MRKFLLRLLLAAVLTIPYFVILLYVHQLDKREYFKGITLAAGISVVVTSDSQTECALNPAYYPELGNYSYSAISLKRVSTKFLDLVVNNPGRIKVFLLDVSPMKLCHVKDPRLSVEDPMVRTLKPRWQDYLSGTLFKYLITQTRERVLQSRHNSTHPFVGGFKELRSQGYVTHPQMASVIENQTSAGFNSNPLLSDDITSQASTAIVCQMIEFAQKNGITVVLLTLPQSKGVRDKFDKEKVARFQAVMNKIASRYGVAWLNYYDMAFEKEEWGDPLHLNHLAVRKFTECVRKDVSHAIGR